MGNIKKTFIESLFHQTNFPPDQTHYYISQNCTTANKLCHSRHAVFPTNGVSLKNECHAPKTVSKQQASDSNIKCSNTWLHFQMIGAMTTTHLSNMVPSQSILRRKEDMFSTINNVPLQTCTISNNKKRTKTCSMPKHMFRFRNAFEFENISTSENIHINKCSNSCPTYDQTMFKQWSKL